MSTLPAAIRIAVLNVEALRNLLASNGENRIAENLPRQEWFDKLFCVYMLRATENEDTTDGAVGSQPFRQFWDVEFWGPAIGAAEQARQQFHNRLHLYHGSFGEAAVQGVFVSDHSGDYAPRADYSDFGLHLAAADLEIVGYTGE